MKLEGTSTVQVLSGLNAIDTNWSAFNYYVYIRNNLLGSVNC